MWLVLYGHVNTMKRMNAMSASTEKKNRQAARAAGTDKKTLAAQEEAKKRAKSKRKWTLGTIGVVVLIALILFLNSGFLYTGTTAVALGGSGYSPAQVNYYYANEYYYFTKQYGSYASIFGLDTSSGLAGAASQSCSMVEGGTWKDYFLQAAYSEMAQTAALVNYAGENGITLTDEEIAGIDSSFTDMETYAKSLGFSGVDNYLEANYGNGVDSKVVRQAAVEAALADKAYSHYLDTLSYTDEELEDYYQSLEGASDLFDYAYYYVAAEKVTVEPETEDGEATEEVTEETLAAAKETADRIMAAYKEAEDGGDVLQRLTDAAATQIADAQATLTESASGSALGAYKEWMMGNRKTGDVNVIENASGEGYSVIAFIGRNDNHYATAQVRHILIKAEASEDGTYTDEAKAAAKSKAEEILAQYLSGDKTEESFAALAEEYSEDEGSNTNGGLYDAVPKGQMVDEFDAFCFEEHKKGDTAIVYGETSGYAGYHVMYYVGEGELYSNIIAKNALMSQDVNAWLEEISAAYEPVPGFWTRLVG